MKFEFIDTEWEYEDYSLSELREYIEHNFHKTDLRKWPEKDIIDFSDIMTKICSLCDTKDFSPVVSIVVDDECLGADFFQTCKVIFDTELNTINHDHLIVICSDIQNYLLLRTFNYILHNIDNIVRICDKPLSDEQKIELLARNIAHYFNGKMYFESKALGTKFELLKRGADRFKWGENDKIQKHIFDIYHFSPVMDHHRDDVDHVISDDRFFEYGVYKIGEECITI